MPHFGVVVGVEGESGWVKGLFIHKVCYRAAGIIEALGLFEHSLNYILALCFFERRYGVKKNKVLKPKCLKSAKAMPLK